MMHVVRTTVMDQNAIIADVEDMFSADFDVVNRSASFSAGERFNFAVLVIGDQRVFANPQFPAATNC